MLFSLHSDLLTERVPKNFDAAPSADQAKSSTAAGASSKPSGIHAITGQKKKTPEGAMSGTGFRGALRGLSNIFRLRAR